MTIDIELSEESIDNAIQQVKDYEEKLRAKTGELVKETAQNVEEYAAYVLAQHIDTGETLASLKKKDYKGGKNTATSVVEVGGAAVWLEFGTGVVTNNAYVGAYVHPRAGYAHMCGLGTYGEGHGAEPNYHGIVATLFMWNSAQAARRDVPNLARRIFR